MCTSDFSKSIHQPLFKNLFFISNYPHYHRLVEIFFIKIYSIFFYQFQTSLTTTDFLKSFYQHLFKNLFFISNYPHYLRLFKIYKSTFFQEFVFYFKLPSLPPTCWNFFINIYSIIFFHFPTTLTTIDLLIYFLSTFIQLIL